MNCELSIEERIIMLQNERQENQAFQMERMLAYCKIKDSENENLHKIIVNLEKYLKESDQGIPKVHDAKGSDKPQY